MTDTDVVAAPGTARRRAGLIGTLLGVAAAGVAAGVAAEKLVLHRTNKKRGVESDPYADEPFGELPADEYLTVTTEEDLPLHVEVLGPADAPLTVVLVHGFCLDMGTFHFQRGPLSTLDGVRTVLYDQPGHGRSGRLAHGEYTLDLLGRSLRRVIDEAAPRGDIVLVGHSMGGMSIMALAESEPELFGPDGRVAGAVLISTSAGGLSEVTFGLPNLVARFRRPLLPLISGAGRVTSAMLDRARQASKDLAWMLTRRYGFGSARVSRSLVSYVEQMNGATPTEVVARYLRTLYSHERLEALPALRATPMLVICGDEDMLTPIEHTRAIVAELPDAELVVVPNGGHVVLLEHSEAVNAVLIPFVRKLVPQHP